MKIKDVLNAKGRTVYTVKPEQSAIEALELLNRHRIGCLVVTDPDGHICGILSERDILCSLNRSDGSPAHGAVSRLMTAREQMVIATEDDGLDYAMRIMTENRIRHLPVVGAGRLAGIISIGDLVKCLLSEKAHENKMLRDYIAGRYPC